jgi:hypothetical protein
MNGLILLSRPPKSPDCNQFDYFLCGVSEKEINKSNHSTKQPPIISIMEKFSREDVERASRQFSLRLEEADAAK